MQYTAFKTRNPAYARVGRAEFATALDIVRKEKLEYLAPYIEHVVRLLEQEHLGRLWDSVRETPYHLASVRNESIVQIVDEFQYLNSEIYRDKACTNLVDDMASGCMRTAEYKNAPLLVSGSWVGWLMNDLIALPGRFQIVFLENMPEEEIVEMAFKYSEHFGLPVTEETVALMAELSEGNPFYVSSLFRSSCPDKDMSTEEGLLKTLTFETIDEQGIVRNTWMEYARTAFRRINDRHAKRILLYLSKHRQRAVTRKELRDELNLPMDDSELEKKMLALVRSDIVQRGGSNFRYLGVQDNVFDKVFRAEYAEEIEGFDPREIPGEYKKLFKEYRAKYRSLLAKYNQAKGAWAEYLIIRTLSHRAYTSEEHFKSVTLNLP